MDTLLRALPAVDQVLADPRVAGLPREVVVAETREVLSRLRSEVRAGERTALPDVPAAVADGVRALLAGRLRPVINATGVVVHTNLGRAPWPAEAVEAARRVAGGYCNLELELESGRRGGRLDGVRALLRRLTGAEDALVVNNTAAAVLLALTALARDREVVVSRGELVEIGGSFRVPDVIASGGARLREVGTTNRTRISDFRAAIGQETAVLLRVHPSNFRVVGFTEAPSREAIVALGRETGLLVLEDLGSGSLDGAWGEPSVVEAVAAGVDLATFSGDKLLGGPQAGILVGRAEPIALLRRHPLYRALRVDKVVLAALEATLAVHLRGEEVPVLSMIRAPIDGLDARARRLAAALSAAGVACRVEPDVGRVGGGALPGQELESRVVVVEVDHPEALAASLRTGEPAVVGRVARGTLRLDVRTLREDDVEVVAERVAAALRSQ